MIVDEVGDRPEQIEVTYSNNEKKKERKIYSCVLLKYCRIFDHTDTLRLSIKSPLERGGGELMIN